MLQVGLKSRRSCSMYTRPTRYQETRNKPDRGSPDRRIRLRWHPLFRVRKSRPKACPHTTIDPVDPIRAGPEGTDDPRTSQPPTLAHSDLLRTPLAHGARLLRVIRWGIAARKRSAYPPLSTHDPQLSRGPERPQLEARKRRLIKALPLRRRSRWR